jgi:thiamine-phosphate pyrophosphorylase
MPMRFMSANPIRRSPSCARASASACASVRVVTAASNAQRRRLPRARFYPSRVKKYPVTTPLDTLTKARRFGVPVVAIGGITAENALPLLRAGADAVAVISGIYSAPDPEAAAREIAALSVGSTARAQ